MDVTILWFLQSDPRAWWSGILAHSGTMAGAGADVVFMEPFIPTIARTDAYVDELR